RVQKDALRVSLVFATDQLANALTKAIASFSILLFSPMVSSLFTMYLHSISALQSLTLYIIKTSATKHVAIR
ncbi:unnamed protein product, partial [Dovyalis caffra]